MSFGVTAAVVGGAAAIGSAAISARASKKAAQAQGDAAAQQLQLQREQFDLARQDQAPYREVGTNALNELALRLGLGGAGGAVGGSGSAGGLAGQALRAGGLVDIGDGGIPIYNRDLYNSNAAYRNAWDDYLRAHIDRFGGGYRADSDYDVIDQELRKRLQTAADQEASAAGPVEQNPLYGSLLRSFTAADFEADPGYQFRLGEGQKQIESSAAARGGLLSGAAAKALTKYNQNFASNEYGNVYNRFRANQTDQFNRLASLAGVGQTATNATQQAGQNFVSGAGNALQYGGTARASGYAGQANAIGAGLGGLTSAFQNIPFGGSSTYTNNPYGNYSAQTTPVQDYYTGVQGRPLA